MPETSWRAHSGGAFAGVMMQLVVIAKKERKKLCDLRFAANEQSFVLCHLEPNRGERRGISRLQKGAQRKLIILPRRVTHSWTFVEEMLIMSLHHSQILFCWYSPRPGDCGSGCYIERFRFLEQFFCDCFHIDVQVFSKEIPDLDVFAIPS
jgi:hypothetical protein